MLICHCNVISERELVQIIRELLVDDPWQLIVPAKVYRELGKRGRCCGCFPNVSALISKVVDAYHSENAVTAASTPMARLAPKRKAEISDARRTRRHRAA